MDAAKRIKGVYVGTNESLLSVVLPTKFVSVLVAADLSSFTSSAVNKMITFVSLLTRIHRLSQFLFLNMKLVELGEGENRY